MDMKYSLGLKTSIWERTLNAFLGSLTVHSNKKCFHRCLALCEDDRVGGGELQRFQSEADLKMDNNYTFILRLIKCKMRCSDIQMEVAVKSVDCLMALSFHSQFAKRCKSSLMNALATLIAKQLPGKMRTVGRILVTDIA